MYFLVWDPASQFEAVELPANIDVRRVKENLSDGLPVMIRGTHHGREVEAYFVPHEHPGCRIIGLTEYNELPGSISP